MSPGNGLPLLPKCQGKVTAFIKNKCWREDATFVFTAGTLIPGQRYGHVLISLFRSDGCQGTAPADGCRVLPVGGGVGGGWLGTEVPAGCLAGCGWREGAGWLSPAAAQNPQTHGARTWLPIGQVRLLLLAAACSLGRQRTDIWRGSSFLPPRRSLGSGLDDAEAYPGAASFSPSLPTRGPGAARASQGRRPPATTDDRGPAPPHFATGTSN